MMDSKESKWCFSFRKAFFKNNEQSQREDLANSFWVNKDTESADAVLGDPRVIILVTKDLVWNLHPTRVSSCGGTNYGDQEASKE